MLNRTHATTEVLARIQPAASPWCFLQLLLKYGHTVVQHTVSTVQHARVRMACIDKAHILAVRFLQPQQLQLAATECDSGLQDGTEHA